MRKLYHTLCKAEVAVCGVGFVLLIVLVFMSAILRMCRISLSWNMDLAMLLLAWTAFVGADIAWRNGQLVGIDIVTRSLPRKVQKVVQLIVFVIVGFALVIIVIYGFRLVVAEGGRKYQSMPISYGIVIASMPFTAASMTLSPLLKIKRCISSFNNTAVTTGQSADQAGLT
jgi:TRAP-type C4-dicarboxylate transport system permease small subunit